jgi:spore germination cell wall hydrolase CwlJ-like protein
MISTLLLSLLYFTIPVKSPQLHKESEVCQGATYFIVHEHSAPWIVKKKLLCRIGKHDFYGDVK